MFQQRVISAGKQLDVRPRAAIDHGAPIRVRSGLLIVFRARCWAWPIARCIRVEHMVIREASREI